MPRLVYSTDPKTQAEIKAKRPKGRPTEKQKLAWSISSCRQFNSTYSDRVESQKKKNAFNKETI
jgi:hypothetical protein